jgi:hypothetical protein
MSSISKNKILTYIIVAVVITAVVTSVIVIAVQGANKNSVSYAGKQTQIAIYTINLNNYKIAIAVADSNANSYQQSEQFTSPYNDLGNGYVYAYGTEHEYTVGSVIQLTITSPQGTVTQENFKLEWSPIVATGVPTVVIINNNGIISLELNGKY